MKKGSRIGFVWVFVLLLTVSLSISVAFATEKLGSCPTTFDPDDSAWAMHRISITNWPLFREHRRIFSYFPDSGEYVMIYPKEMSNPGCVLFVYSYGARDAVDGKRVWGKISTHEREQYYLLTESGWKQGDYVGISYSNCDTTERCDLKFLLYRGSNTPIASRVLSFGK